MSMKSRIRKVATFLALNLLFFALYLNFVHADAQLVQDNAPTLKEPTSAFGETEVVKNPENYNNRQPIPAASFKTGNGSQPY